MPTFAYYSLLSVLSIGGAETAFTKQKTGGKAPPDGVEYWGIVFGIGFVLHAFWSLFLLGIF